MPAAPRHRWLQGLLLALAGCFPILAIMGFWSLLPPLLMAFFASGLALAVLRGGQGRRRAAPRSTNAGDGGDNPYDAHSPGHDGGNGDGRSNDGDSGGGGDSGGSSSD
jgi:uncharacterized membrane protein YgcG